MLKQLFVGLFFIPLLFSSNAKTEQDTSAKEKDEGVVVSLLAKRTEVTLHEPIVATFEAKIDTTQDVHLDLGRDRKETFKFVIIPPDGNRTELPQLRKSGFTRNGLMVIKPGQSYSQDLLLNEWFDFNTVGTYQVQVQLTKPVYSEQRELTVRNQGLVIRFTIMPRDEAALSRTCDALAAQIEGSNSYENSAYAAMQLSFVSDPITVPYLRRALVSGKLVEPIAIRGLERIGNVDAVRALSDGLKIEYNQTSRLSRAALTRLQLSSPDPVVRQEIIRVLSQTDPAMGVQVPG